MTFSTADIRLATGAEIYGPHTYVVNVNGSIVGLTRYPQRFVANFRKLRRAGRFSEFVSVYINNHHRTVLIASDGGRICRPMIIVDNGKPRVTIDHVAVSGCFSKQRLLNLDASYIATQTRRAYIRRLPPQGARRIFRRQ